MADLTSIFNENKEKQVGMSYPQTNPNLPIPQVEQPVAEEVVETEVPMDQPELPVDTGFVGPIHPNSKTSIADMDKNSLEGVLKALRGARMTHKDVKLDTSAYDKMNEDLANAQLENRELLNSARQREDSNTLNNDILKIGAQLNQAFANRAGNTNIKVDPLQLKSNDVERVTGDNKNKMTELMQKYKNIMDKQNAVYNNDKYNAAGADAASKYNAGLELEAQKLMFNERQKELDRLEKEKDRDLKRSALEASGKTKESAEEKAARDLENKLTLEEKKDELKEKTTMKKENREFRKNADKALESIDDRLNKIKQAREIMGKTWVSGSGPLDQYISKVTPNGQSLARVLNSLALNEMTSMFAGMSKAIDSDAERAFFESTQPSMGAYESVNLDTLKALEEKLKGLKEKTKKSINDYDNKTGRFSEDTRTDKEYDKAGKTIVGRDYSASTGKTRIRYSDGTFEIIDSQK